MKKLILLAVLIIGISAPAVAQDTEESRTEAAIRYAGTVDMIKIVNDMTLEMSKSLPIESREDFLRKTLYTEAEVNELREMMLEQMVNHFTTKELDALTAFYGSPEGQSLIVKMPQYYASVYPQFQQLIIKKYEAQ